MHADIRTLIGDDRLYNIAASEAFPRHNKAHLLTFELPDRSGDVSFISNTRHHTNVVATGTSRSHSVLGLICPVPAPNLCCRLIVQYTLKSFLLIPAESGYIEVIHTIVIYMYR
jgi:hypothetical protein